jgi:DNA-directed RNA polymerase
LLREASVGLLSFETVALMTIRGTRKKLVLNFEPEVRAKLDAAHVRKAKSVPWLLPMISQPIDWKWDGERYVGGYYKTDVPLVKESYGMKQTNDLLVEDVVPQGVLDAINKVSRTPWVINNEVLQVAYRAIECGVDEVLPVAMERELPPSIPAEDWAKMDKGEQQAATMTRRAVHDHNNKLRARRDAMSRQMQVAQEFREYDAIYFPHNLDFRGRMYPMPQDLHPQADDFGRSLLRFATAKPLGHEGFLWLCYHVANTYGLDKEDRKTQRTWVLDGLDMLYAVARDPFNGEGFRYWQQAEEPWQFLAACQELEAAFMSGNVYEYASSLPVYVDGTCNGLQHLSAMGLDPVGAEAVNLTPGPRQDIYQIVADKVTRVKEDAMLNDCEPEVHPAAGAWRGHVTRKTVKRGVMTVPYGLTDVGMRDQLIQDGMCSGLDGNVMENATYMRDCMKAAINETVVAATAIMEWMQDNATILAKNGKGVEWTTPAGFRVRQAYYKTVHRAIRTITGRASIYEQSANAPIRVSKQATSIAPNIVHSFDAAHMTLTIAAAGDLSFSVIHDSFGCHAADMAHLGKVLRQEFVGMYRDNWFESLQAEFQAMAGSEVPLIPAPARGAFDVEQITGSDFFFA